MVRATRRIIRAQEYARGRRPRRTRTQHAGPMRRREEGVKAFSRSSVDDAEMEMCMRTLQEWEGGVEYEQHA
jgi:hypothetical protein